MNAALRYMRQLKDLVDGPDRIQMSFEGVDDGNIAFVKTAAAYTGELTIHNITGHACSSDQ